MLMIKGQNNKQVPKFTNVGQRKQEDACCRNEIKIRIAMAKKRIQREAENIDTEKHKCQITQMNPHIRLIMIYCSGTWTWINIKN